MGIDLHSTLTWERVIWRLRERQDGDCTNVLAEVDSIRPENIVLCWLEIPQESQQNCKESQELDEVCWSLASFTNSFACMLAELVEHESTKTANDFEWHRLGDKSYVRTWFLQRVIPSKACTSQLLLLEDKVFFITRHLQNGERLRLESGIETSKPTHKDQRPSNDTSTAIEMVRFLRLAMKLKKERRTGWVLRGIEDAESVADHSWCVALCCLMVGEEGLDWRKAALMGLVHDISEAVIGDYTPTQISESEKHKKEREAMETLLGCFSNKNERAQAMAVLWNEYEERSTPEARLVKDLDRFEMVMQADIYEREGDAKDLEEFFQSVAGKIQHPVVKTWFDALQKDRIERINNHRL